MSSNIQVGDWIRFQCAGELVIGVVEYVRTGSQRYPYGTYAITNQGMVAVDEVIEVRAKAESSSK